MEYTVQKLANLAGISARTLRFYDEIGLLKPARITAAGYRIYGSHEVDTLQQILFFRELGLELSTIAEVLNSPSFHRLTALREHLHALESQQARLTLLIENVQRTIQQEEGKRTMSDTEKFAGFKQKLVDDNEKKYGREAREKYGDKAIDESNARMMRMTQEQYDSMQKTAVELGTRLEAAVKAGLAPDSGEGRAIAALHKDWLSYTWSSYTKEAHRNLSQLYMDDERFTAYYDKNVAGCAAFLRDAVHAFTD